MLTSPLSLAFTLSFDSFMVFVMEPYGQGPCLPQAGVVPCATPMWGDIPRLRPGQAGLRWRIPPRPKVVVSCCRNESFLSRTAPRNGSFLDQWPAVREVLIETKVLEIFNITAHFLSSKKGVTPPLELPLLVSVIRINSDYFFFTLVS